MIEESQPVIKIPSTRLASQGGEPVRESPMPPRCALGEAEVNRGEIVPIGNAIEAIRLKLGR